jgi:histidinol-phosphate aminotransferase
VALACLPEALGDQTYIQHYVSEVRESRTRLERALEAFGIQFWPSHANFVLARVGAAASFVEQMRRRGILVRDRTGDQGCEGCVRITLGPRADADRLLTALQETCVELGIAQGASRR